MLLGWFCSACIITAGSLNNEILEAGWTRIPLNWDDLFLALLPIRSFSRSLQVHCLRPWGSYEISRSHPSSHWLSCIAFSGAIGNRSSITGVAPSTLLRKRHRNRRSRQIRSLMGAEASWGSFSRARCRTPIRERTPSMNRVLPHFHLFIASRFSLFDQS